MSAVSIDSISDSIREAAWRITGEVTDFDALLDMIGNAPFVLIGEASHGTHEFYQTRAELTKRLIAEKNFTAVAVEADWPDTYRVNRYVRGQSNDPNAARALGDFQRFPTWMWRNLEVVAFIEWLRDYNAALPAGQPQTGFYGLDLYSLSASINAVLKFLDKVDPQAARRARFRYSCFEDFGENTQAYGYAANYNLEASCENQVIDQLVEMHRRAAEFAGRNGRVARDDFFFAEQNARLVRNAEEYYRSMFHGQVDSWNLRDRHMMETLQALVEHLKEDVADPKVVLWAHNSHLGDARATQMGERGEWNVGQLARERYGEAAVLIGFTTFAGEVTAASDWDAAAERKLVRPALKESYELLFHQSGLHDFYLPLRDGSNAARELRPARLERAIGVIYRPESERISHYFRACLPRQFDAVIHFDKTQAVEPLERTPRWITGEAPETFPTGF